MKMNQWVDQYEFFFNVCDIFCALLLLSVIWPGVLSVVADKAVLTEIIKT